MSRLTKGNWILQSASTLTPLPYIVLVEVSEENPTSYRYVIGKEALEDPPKGLRDFQGSSAHTLTTTALN